MVSGFAQDKPTLVDEFTWVSNDSLMAHVDYFWTELLKTDKNGYVLLSGSAVEKRINQRRIEGCNYWRRHPRNTLKYIFEDDSTLKVQFWSVPKLSDDPRFKERPLDYRLNDLDKPLELSTSMATDEYCPRVFDLEWYANFMNANPKFTGKVVIDVGTNRVFIDRVIKYRKELRQRGIAANRIRYFRHHFIHERDEQWWLIPSKKR